MIAKHIPIATESLCGDFKFLGAKAKAKETENPKEQTDCLCADHFDGSDLNLGQHENP